MFWGFVIICAWILADLPADASRGGRQGCVQVPWFLGQCLEQGSTKSLVFIPLGRSGEGGQIMPLSQSFANPAPSFRPQPK